MPLRPHSCIIGLNQTNEVRPTMINKPVPMKYTLALNIPAHHVYDLASNASKSSTAKIRSVAKAFLDCAHEANKLLHLSRSGANVDFGPVLDFWFGTTLDDATELLQSKDESAIEISQGLINLAESIHQSRANYFASVKETLKRQ